MSVTVYRTGHEIADTVACALVEGCRGMSCDEDVAIGYGILRGMSKMLRHHKHWFEVDRGYSHPGHYDGYYRISHMGTQPLYADGHLPEGSAGIPEMMPIRRDGTHVLLCPPTQPVCEFFGIDVMEWLRLAIADARKTGLSYSIRTKDCAIPLDEHLAACAGVITFNSSVGWEAVRRGIPCLSSTGCSTVGSYYQENSLDVLIKKFDAIDRRPLFDFMLRHQFTLSEIRAGKAWALIQRYISGTMDVNQLQAM